MPHLPQYSILHTMQLTVRNFGPIKKAEKIAIKPLTLFAGPCNSGKSYLAMLVYITAKIFTLGLKEFVLEAHNIFTDKNYSFDIHEDISTDSKIVKDIANQIHTTIKKLFYDRWHAEALKCFGKEWEQLSTSDNPPVSVVLSDSAGDFTFHLLGAEENKLFGILLAIVTAYIAAKADWHKKKNISTVHKGASDKEDLNEEFTSDVTSRIIYVINLIMHKMITLPDISHSAKLFQSFDSFLQSTVDTLDSTVDTLERERNGTHYLPAGRCGLIQHHNTFVSAIVQNAPYIGLSDNTITPYSGIVGDFLGKLIKIANIPPNTWADRLLKDIERDILHGTITIAKSPTGYPDFRYRVGSKTEHAPDMALMNAASSVSELAPIILFVRHYLSPGDIFIIEEPEAHQHPEAQRYIAALLVQLVNKGVCVLATTHSDIILEQVSNFMHADELPGATVLNKSARRRAINRDKVGVYEFRVPKRSRQTTVHPTLFDDDTGSLTDDHLNVSTDLYNETVVLHNLREEKSHEEKPDAATEI